MKRRTFLLTLPTLSLATAHASFTASRPSIQSSDVVFMYAPKDPKQYDAYAGTITGWGSRPRSMSQNNVQSFRNRVEEAHKREMKYCASVDYLVDFRGLIDFYPDSYMDCVCRNLENDPIRVPWLWDHSYKGVHYYWGCTNNPRYKKYLRDQVERACSAPIDGLHIDDYNGTAHCSWFAGGCFCPYCMQGFRQYLNDHFSQPELKAQGITTIDDFDYGDYLRSRNLTTDDFKHHQERCPLKSEFQDFQNQRMLQNITETYQYAESLRKKPLLRSVNASASSPRTVLPSSVIDYFCGEIHQRHEDQLISADSVFVYKMVEALGSKQTATASGQDWAWIKANNKSGLVRCWISQAYAFGSVFMVPHNQWCFTQELGTHWWHGKPEDFAFLYQFVRDQKNRLDQYLSYAPALLLFTRDDFYKVRTAAIELIKANIPFALFNIDESLPQQSLPSSAQYFTFSEESKSWLQQHNKQAHEYHGIDSLLQNLINPIVVDEAKNIRVSLRQNNASLSAPWICHILNQNYDQKSDTVIPTTCTLKISNALLTGKKISMIQHQPGQSSKAIQIQRGDEVTKADINLDTFWSIIELRTIT